MLQFWLMEVFINGVRIPCLEKRLLQIELKNFLSIACYIRTSEIVCATYIEFFITIAHLRLE